MGKANFDTSPGNVVEDICWARTVQQMGYSIVYEPEAPMIHYHDEGLKRYCQRSRTEGYGLMYTGIYPNPLKALIGGFVRDNIADFLFLLPRPKYWRWLFYAPFWNAARNFGLFAGIKRFRKDGGKPMLELTENKLRGDQHLLASCAFIFYIVLPYQDANTRRENMKTVLLCGGKG